MSQINALLDDELAFLQPYLPNADNTIRSRAADGNTAPDHLQRDEWQSQNVAKPDEGDLPFVTLTYASSLDGNIALAPGVRTAISGPETKNMTHYLRQRHDAILVGVGTAAADSPSLNCRYPGVTTKQQPRPIVVDPTSRWDVTTAPVVDLARKGQGKAPWVVVLPNQGRAEELYECGGEYIAPEHACSSQSQNSISESESQDSAGSTNTIQWIQIFRNLKKRGINSVMVEGGASVIGALLTEPQLVSSVIITIAPKWFGDRALSATPKARTVNGMCIDTAQLENTAWRQFGQDAVLCGTLSPLR